MPSLSDIILASWEEEKAQHNKPIAIDKMSQLERNLSEDLVCDDVSDYARGVLFGNAFRLQEPSTREEFFTEKCISAAKRIKEALVRTPDVFHVANSRSKNQTTSHSPVSVWKPFLSRKERSFRFPPFLSQRRQL